MGLSPHKLCRPPKDAVEVERWTGSRWVADDGNPGLAFSGRAASVNHRGEPDPYPAAWYSGDCNKTCHACDGCAWPCARVCCARGAMRRTSKRWGAANGFKVKAVK